MNLRAKARENPPLPSLSTSVTNMLKTLGTKKKDAVLLKVIEFAYGIRGRW
jgi:hypothetical protein